MDPDLLPSLLRDNLHSFDEALLNTVKSGSIISSGFATSEPYAFYQGLWDHIQKNDITDIRIQQGLFMGPHKLCVGDALSAKGRLEALANALGSLPYIGDVVKKANNATQKLDGLDKLISHYRELQRRNIIFESGFMSAVSNITIPDNAVTRMLYPEFAGRNSSRMGITDMHSVHFPDAVGGLALDPDKGCKVDTFVMVMTPPDGSGEMSHGPANGANGELVDHILETLDANILVFVNEKYPFTRGYGPAPNTVHVDRFEKLAKAGKLFVVIDDTDVPALPADSFADPPPEERAIAENIVNHIEMNKDFTYGRAIQVGIGGTGVLAIKGLRDSSWEGRMYTEMLEPFTLDLFEAGKIKGTHFIENDGTRTRLDGKMICTFSICETGSDFYDKIHNNDSLVVAPASRVVVSEGFYGGMGINNCLAVDFHGHVNSGGRYKNHHSGIGGAAMIMRGLAKGGVGYLCLKSTHKTPEGELRSSIMPFMPEGTPIALVGPDIWGTRSGARMFLATEHGVARLSTRSQADFIRSIISVADPRFKDWLVKQAWEEFRVKV